jgi:hypothetical protein
MDKLEVTEGIQSQSSDEEITRTLTTTPWGSDPTSVSVKAYLERTGADVTTTVFPTNTPSVEGDVITFSPMKSLVKYETYRVEVKFTAESNIWETYFKVYCEF